MTAQVAGHAVVMNKQVRRCALVLGMHNSGTSLLGNLMHAAGIPLGPDLLLRETIPEERRPRYDYFEDEAIVQLQDACLLELQRHWSSYRSSFAMPDRSHPGRERFRHGLAALVPKRLERDSLWLVKDPRSAVLVDDWLDVLEQLGVEARPLIVHRDPASNVRSFSSKGQVPELWAEALWQRTYAQALAAAKHLPPGHSAFTSFEALMQTPAEEISRLCAWLGRPLDATTRQTLGQRVDRSLPTESRAPSPTQSSELHPATNALCTRLLAERGDTNGLPVLLADQLAEAAETASVPLELNRICSEQQTLLPKVSVTIVTCELQGWGAGGGIGSAMRELAVSLSAAGHRVDVLLVQPGSSNEGPPLPGVTVHRLDSSDCSRLALGRRVTAWLGDHRSDVVHLHDWLGLASGLKDALQPHAPQIVVGLHGPSAWTRSGNPWPKDPSGALLVDHDALFIEGVVMALELDGLEQADWLVSPSQAMADWVSQHLFKGTKPAALVVNRNCPLPVRLSAGSSPTSAAANQATDTNIDCVYFGRLEQRKGLALFLEALLHMDQRPQRVLFLGSDCVVGQHSDGQPLWGRDLIEQELATSGITVQHEAGLLRDAALQRLINLQAVVVIPSLIENSPCVVEELLDSGLRMVVTDVGGTAELIRAEDRRWLSGPDAANLAGHLDAALHAQRHNSEAYRLGAALDSWRIQLSWQAFHERLPSRLPRQRPEPNDAQAPDDAAPSPRPLWRRAAGKAWRLGLRTGRKLKSLIVRF